MNLGNLITEAQRLAGRVDRDWNARTTRWLNEAQEEWAISVPWATLIRTETFTLDGTRQLVLPPRVLTVRWVGDRTNKVPLDPSEYFDRERPASLFGDTTGAIYNWREGGAVACYRQPASASKIAVLTTASDSFNVYVGGLARDSNASGYAEEYYFAEESIAILADTTYTSTNTYVRVDVLGKDDSTPADVVVTAGSSRIARIPAHGYKSEYRVIEFIHIPDAGTQVDVSYVHRPQPLFETYQCPHPSVDTEYLIWYAASMIHHAMGAPQEAQLKRDHAEQILNRRIYKEKTHGDKDLRMMPSYDYWNHDDQYTWPDNG